jgi:hypothetical protein
VPALHRSNATARNFWTLMDRWNVPDRHALRLIDYPAGLTKSGKRPRFALTTPQSERLAYLIEIDINLRTLSVDATAWLARENGALGAKPLDLMIRRGMPGIRSVLQFLNKWALRQQPRRQS